MLRETFIVLSAFIKIFESFHSSSLKVYMKALDAKEASTLKRSTRQKIIKIITEIKQLETKNTIQRINKTKTWFFEKITRYSYTYPSHTIGIWRNSIQINKIRNERET